MYTVNIKLNLFDVDFSFFNLNQPTPSILYRTRDWMIDSQWRLGDIPIYVELLYDQIPVALFPFIIYNKLSDYPPVNPHRIIKEATGVTTDKPVAYCATLFGLGCPILTYGIEINWESVFILLKTKLREQYNCEYLVFGYFCENDDPLAGYVFKNNNVVTNSHKLLGILDIGKFNSFDDYKKSLSKNTRASYTSEAKIFAKNDLHIKNLPITKYDLDLIGEMSSNVFRKYGNEVDPIRITNFAKHISMYYPNDSGIISCWTGESIISYVLYIKYGNVLYAHTFGRNYEIDKYKSYYIVAYHEIIKYAINTGMKYINYSGGADWTKERRGVNMLQTYSYVC